eukprot:CAMPEP_0184458214 /NCGR_PEP_ID=MMETSP0740-20130409/32555_1 /TAXON_ID=385413 /ORGANISM="Thalassiosira miniscula, Strain CCMP1093" /LENGTH=47 /DNA_ID= /DNA_START= /DNA_END= /DNA_ORIENTATION=
MSSNDEHDASKQSSPFFLKVDIDMVESWSVDIAVEAVRLLHAEVFLW